MLERQGTRKLGSLSFSRVLVALGLLACGGTDTPPPSSSSETIPVEPVMPEAPAATAPMPPVSPPVGPTRMPSGPPELTSRPMSAPESSATSVSTPVSTAPGALPSISRRAGGYEGGPTPVDYPPVMDIAVSGGVLFGVDDSACLRPSAPASGEEVDCANVVGGRSLLIDGLILGLDHRSRLAADGAGGFYVAVVSPPPLDVTDPLDVDSSSDAPPDADDAPRAADLVVALPTGSAPIVLPGFDFSAGVGIEVVHSADRDVIYVLDRDPDGFRIQALGPDLEQQSVVRVDPQLPLANPGSLAVDAAGAFYVLSDVDPKVRKLGPSGNIDPTFNLSGVEGLSLDPRDLAIDSNGDVFVADADPSVPVRVFDAAGALLSAPFTLLSAPLTLPDESSTTTPEYQFTETRAIALGSQGEVFVLDMAPFPAPFAANISGETLFGFTPR